MKAFNDREVRWGVIGAGSVCEVKSAPAMQKISHSSVVAVARRNAAKAEAYANRHKVSKWYNDSSDLIHDPDVNAVYIATPPDSHLLYTEMAASAGKPVYVEKPMARDHSECLKMIQACEKAGVPLFVAYYRRMLPHFVKIKALIESDVIGKVRTVHIQFSKSSAADKVAEGDNWRVDPKKAGGGHFYDLASHQLDYLDFLFGQITRAYGISTNQAGLYPAEDLVTASFEFENGVLGSGNWCFTTAEISQKDHTIIIGSKGQIEYESFGKGEFTLKTDDGEEVFQFDQPEHIQYPLIQSIVGELLGTAQCPSTGITAARTNWVMSQIVYQTFISAD
ncbi:MAG: Gfo/Idh/MocA family oxidoreductase [Balneolales bacterium]